MRRCEISGCIHEGCHSHHIVFRSQGGPDITMNLIRLCPYHHNMSPEGVHMNPTLDKRLKCELQREYESLFPENELTVELVADRIGMSRKKAEKYFSKIQKNPDGTMNREDIIRRLMGGKFY